MKFITKKHLGQHFLFNISVIHEIMHYLNVNVKDHIVEIGPGFGSLTSKILDSVNVLHAIEIDYNLASYLRKKYSHLSNFNIVNHDVMMINFKDFYCGNKLRIIGSLPYNIASLILLHLIKFKYFIEDIYVILQQEVAERVVSYKNNKNYSRLSVIMQYHFRCNKILNLSRYHFNPVPKVNSQMLCLIPIKNRVPYAKNYFLFYSIVKHTFQYRRKKLRNSLKFFLKHSYLFKDIPCDINLRPENLSISDFVNLSNYIGNCSCQSM